ncbi:hypothetical protein NHX12_029531, partial [Muraenolepis orangiensis]
MALHDHRAHGRSHGHHMEAAAARPAEVRPGRDTSSHHFGGLLLTDYRGAHSPTAGLQ